jgi:peptidoglycan/xylan/chitin deacetylase (PgdA/CDA1 family)
MKNGFVTNYSEVKSQKPATLKSFIRNIALTGLSLATDRKYLDKPRVQFLYLHHLFTDEEKQLDTLLKTLSHNYTFISYKEGVEKILAGTIDKPYIVFSSDDGFKNNLRAAEILGDYNAKACFFINPGIVGETDFEKIKRHCSETLRFPAVEFLNWNEVEKLQQWGHEIGGHTMMHMNIAEASEQKIKDDMGQTFDILKKRCGTVNHFAFPYGRFHHFSAAGRKAVFEAGFTSCATAERGCHVNPPHGLNNTNLCIRRDHIMLGWTLQHIMYFLANSAKKANVNNNLFPASLI